MILLKFNWAPSSTLFEIGGFGIHIYSLMFIVAFVLGIRIYKKIFIKEKVDLKYLEPIFIYMVISTLLGARLGDVFFYHWRSVFLAWRSGLFSLEKCFFTIGRL